MSETVDFSRLINRIDWAFAKAGIERYCSNCGAYLIPGSVSYFEGFHLGGCEVKEE